jgi:hypothetical protein
MGQWYTVWLVLSDNTKKQLIMEELNKLLIIDPEETSDENLEYITNLFDKNTPLEFYRFDDKFYLNALLPLSEKYSDIIFTLGFDTEIEGRLDYTIKNGKYQIYDHSKFMNYVIKHYPEIQTEYKENLKWN